MGNDVKQRWDPSPSSRMGDFGVLGSHSDSMDTPFFLEMLLLLRLSEEDIDSVHFPSAFSISCLKSALHTEHFPLWACVKSVGYLKTACERGR